MSYEGILAFFGLTQFQIEMLLIGGVILTLVGYFIIIYWHFIVAGAVLFGVMVIFLHHPTPKVETVEVTKTEPVVVEEPPSNKDENFQKTSIIDPIWLFNSLMRMREINQTPAPVAQVEPTPSPVVEEPVKPKQIVETEQMREYIKQCTELTKDSGLCRDNWISMDEAGVEIILQPVERKSRKQIKQAKVKVDNSFSKPSDVKLLDVDNKEYKERRALVLSKPNAVILQETYR